MIPSTKLSGTSYVCLLLAASFFLGVPVEPAHAENPSYRTVTPSVGDPFELRSEFSTTEPVVAGTETPLPGWLGSGHMVLKDGRLLLVYAHQDQCKLSYSSDEGKTWTEPIPVPTAQPEGIRIHRPAVIATAEGDIWVIFYALLRYDVKNPKNSVNNLWAVRSGDGGKTWDEARCLYEGYVGMLQGSIQTSKGNLIIPICDYREVRRFVSLCLVSKDRGKTWQTSSIVDLGYPKTSLPLSPNLNGGALEPSVAEMPDGRLLMMIRTILGEFYHSISSDGGFTWNAPSPVSLTCGGPCNVVSMPGGGVAVAYNPANMESPETKRWGSPIGYDTETLAGMRQGPESWHVIHDFVRQVPGKVRVVHSTITGLPNGKMLINLPGRSTLLSCDMSLVLNKRNN